MKSHGRDPIIAHTLYEFPSLYTIIVSSISHQPSYSKRDLPYYRNDGEMNLLTKAATNSSLFSPFRKSANIYVLRHNKSELKGKTHQNISCTSKNTRRQYSQMAIISSLQVRIQTWKFHSRCCTPET